MNKKKIILSFTTLMLSLVVIHQVVFNGLYLADISLGTNYLAKEYCSCRYTMQMNKVFCDEYVKDKRVPAKIVTDESSKKISVKLFKIFYSEAKFLDQKKGCLLTVSSS